MAIIIEKSPGQLTRKEAIIMSDPIFHRESCSLAENSRTPSLNEIATAMFPVMVDRLLAPGDAPLQFPDSESPKSDSSSRERNTSPLSDC